MTLLGFMSEHPIATVFLAGIVVESISKIVVAVIQLLITIVYQIRS